MNTREQHTWSDDQKLEQLNKQLEIPYPESKEDVWDMLEGRLVEIPATKRISLFQKHTFRWMAAASILLLLGMIGFMRYYSVEKVASPGQHLTVNLPDGSSVQLNAVSSLNYHPYWWRFSRNLNFEGEAYFEVEKGTRFSVQSPKGTTTVLGTSFNIYSRDNSYQVVCLTGKVEVSNQQNEKVILLPNQKASLTKSGFDILKDQDVASETAWIDNRFAFTAMPLNEVFQEIERQYGIKLNGKEKFTANYSGNFTRNQSVQQVLEYVCRAFNINFEQVNKNEYKLIKTDQ